MLKLEVGKKYKNKQGEIVEIVNGVPRYNLTYPFTDSKGYTYTKEGIFVSGGSEYDLVEEVPVFDMKTQPWFIRVNEANFELIRDWVVDKGFDVEFNFNTELFTYITNVDVCRRVYDDYAVFGSTDIENRAKEIKLNFKTTLESVEYPEVVDKDEEERIAIRKEMEVLAERLKALEGN